MRINIANNKTQKRLAILLLVLTVLVMFMILMGVGEFWHLKRWIYANHINDKITHIAFGAVLTFLTSYIFHPRKLHLLGYKIDLGTLIIFFLISFDEVSQAIMPGRDADIFDLMASYVGLAAGYFIFRVWSDRKTD